MSNGLQTAGPFQDPLLVRTSDACRRCQRKELELIGRCWPGWSGPSSPPQISIRALPTMLFGLWPRTADHPVPQVLQAAQAPSLTLDVMTPSDVSFLDVEQGKIDLVINRFDQCPSFHQVTLWTDPFICLMSRDNPILKNFDLPAYLASDHIWVSKTGMGVGVGVNPDDVQRLGWVDSALAQLGEQRRIRVFTRHYQAAMTLAEENDLIVTLPARATAQRDNPRVWYGRFRSRSRPWNSRWPGPVAAAHHRWARQMITGVAGTWPIEENKHRVRVVSNISQLNTFIKTISGIYGTPCTTIV